MTMAAGDGLTLINTQKMKRLTLLLCCFLSIFSAAAQSTISVDPKDVKQNPSFRMVTDLQIAAWNKTIESLRTPEKLTTNAIVETSLQQFVTAADKAKWNANSKLKDSENIGLKQVDSITVMPYLKIGLFSDYDMRKIAAPAEKELLIIFNTDFQQLYYRTSKTEWKKIWDSL